MESHEALHKKIDQLLERQKIIEDKVTRLENEIHASQHLITEHDFIEVRFIFNISEGFQKFIFYLNSARSRVSRNKYFLKKYIWRPRTFA